MTARAVRVERLARRVERVLAAQSVKAATPKFGCLMAMLPSLDSKLPNWAAERVSPEDLHEEGIETEPHITALYGFDLGFNCERLASVLPDRVSVKLGKVGRFDCLEYDVIKVDVESPDLKRLHEKLSRLFKRDVTPSKWGYNPHLTVAYVKKGACKELDGSNDFDGLEPHISQMLYSLPEKQGRMVFNLGCSRDSGINLTARAGKLYTLDRVQARYADEATVAPESGRSAKAVVRDAGGRVLVLKDARHGDWDLPGGHLREGEDLDRGLHREVMEETGLDLLGATWRRTANRGRTEVFDASVPGREPAVVLSPEHTAYRWVPEADAEDMAAYWFREEPAAAPGSSLAGLGARGGRGHGAERENALAARESARRAAEAEVARAVVRVVTLAEALATADRVDEGAYAAYAAAALYGAVLAAYGRAAGELAALEGLDDLVPAAEAEAHARARAGLLEDFPARALARVRNEAEAALAAGEDLAEVHARVGREGDRVAQGEGRVVAETEAQAVAGAATLRALKLAGYATAHWVTVGDDRVRETHLANEAAGEVKVGDKFPNGCRYPGDPAAPLAETVNCRCWLVGASRKEAA